MQPESDTAKASRIDEFVTYLRTGRRTGSLEYKYNHNHDQQNGQFTSGDARSVGSGPHLTPEGRLVARRIEQDFFLRTGKRITVNSGTRSPRKQAIAMLGKRGDWRIYKNQVAIAEIGRALRRSEAAGGTPKQHVDAMAEVISRQTTRGVYVSDHLTSRALDLSVANLKPRERAILVEVSKKHSKKVLDEKLPPHIHVKY